MKIRYNSKGWGDLNFCSSIILISLVLGVLFQPFEFLLNLFAVSFSIFFPGYILVACFFPTGSPDSTWGFSGQESSRNPGISLVERLMSSFFISLLIASTTSLSAIEISVLNVFSTGSSLLADLLLISAITLPVAYIRRLFLIEELRFSFTIDLILPDFPALEAKSRIFFSVMFLCTFFSLISLTNLSTMEKSEDKYTEFYLLDSEGGLNLIPNSTIVDQQEQIIIGISNFEGQDSNYSVEIKKSFFGEVDIADIEDLSTPIRSEKSIIAIFDGIGEEESRDFVHEFSLNETGTWRVDFLLFQNLGEPETSPYRSLNLWIYALEN